MKLDQQFKSLGIIKDVQCKDDGTLDITFWDDEAFEEFKKLAREHCDQKRYSRKAGERLITDALMAAIEEQEKKDANK